MKFTEKKCALVIAHPGHELCIYGWLEAATPKVFVLTDGSGRKGISRLTSTTRILADAGARVGSIYGRFTDQNVYEAILDHDYRLFEKLTVELAESFVDDEIDFVTGDAAEGYNPIHDTCRLVINGAVRLASRMGKREITNTDFLLYAPHTALYESEPAGMGLALDGPLLQRKLEAAQAYPDLKSDVDAMLERKTHEALERFPELSADFANLVTRQMGKDAYGTECLRLVPPAADGDGSSVETPFYERYGQMLVSEGTYKRAISYRDHISPLAKVIDRFVNASLRVE